MSSPRWFLLSCIGEEGNLSSFMKRIERSLSLFMMGFAFALASEHDHYFTTFGRDKTESILLCGFRVTGYINITDFERDVENCIEILEKHDRYIRHRVESGCSSLKIVGPPHQTQKVVNSLAKVWLEFGCYPVPIRGLIPQHNIMISRHKVKASE